MQEVLDDLADAGYGDVHQVVTAEEDLMFSLPKELRKDAAGNPDERGLGGRVKRLDWQRDHATQANVTQATAAQADVTQASATQAHD